MYSVTTRSNPRHPEENLVWSDQTTLLIGRVVEHAPGWFATTDTEIAASISHVRCQRGPFTTSGEAIAWLMGVHEAGAEWMTD